MRRRVQGDAEASGGLGKSPTGSACRQNFPGGNDDTRAQLNANLVVEFRRLFDSGDRGGRPLWWEVPLGRPSLAAMVGMLSKAFPCSAQ